MKYTMSELVEAVKDHAEKHYEDGGWDVIVEAWDDKMIASVLGRDETRGCCRTPKGAIRRIREDAVSVYADQQADARNSAF